MSKALCVAYGSGGDSGKNAALQKLEEVTNAWSLENVNLAIIGASGAGKSSFINAARNLRNSNEPLWAPTGVGETTMECKSYKHPRNENILFWDIPGVGSTSWPQHNYLERIEFSRYDAYLILSSVRFSTQDQWLAELVQTAGKQFYFVRTKISLDVENEKGENNREEKDTLKTIRDDIQRNLKHIRSDTPIFLIDSKKPQRFEFEALQKRLIEDLPSWKRSAMIMSLDASSRFNIELKVAELRKRAWKKAVLSAACSVVPVPGLSILVDMRILLQEAEFYFTELGLDSESLRKRAATVGVDERTILAIVREQFPAQFGVQFIKSILSVGIYVGIYDHRKVVEEFARLIPFVGLIIVSHISLAGTKYCLNDMITKMSEMSLKIALQINAESV